jgi:tetratricopeptide (TPR) repeat protein
MQHGKRVWPTYICVAFLWFILTTLSSAQSVDETFEHGRKLYQTGSYAEAISYFEKAAQTPAYRLTAILYQARCWHQLGKYPTALTLYKEGLASEPGHCDFLYERARTYIEIKQWQDALNDLNQCDVIYPQNVFISYLRGRCCQAQQQYPDAIAIYQNVLRWRPAFGKVHQQLGECYFAVNRPDEAMKSFAEAANYKDVDSEHIYFYQAKICQDRQDLPLAIAYLEKTVAQNNKNAEAWQMLGGLYHKQKEYSKALDAYNAALPMLKDNKGGLRRVRALILYQLQRYPEAIEEFAKTAEEGAVDADLHYFWGCSLSNSDKLDEALEHLKLAISLQAKYWPAYFQCAKIYQKKGQYGESIRSYNEMQDLGYRGYELNFGLAESQQKLKDYDKAIFNYTEAIKQSPQYAEAYVKRSEVRMQKGAYSAAIDDMNQGISLSPQAVYYKQRGLLYARFGKYTEAVKDISQAITLEPQNYAFYYERGMVQMQQKGLDEAIVDFGEAIKRKSDYGEAYYQRAQCYAMLARNKNSLSDYNNAVKLLPKEAWVYYHRGLLCNNMGHWESALQDFTSAVSLQEVAVFYASQAEVLLTMGNKTSDVQEQRGKYDKALASASRSLELDPNQKKYYLLRADIYAKQGKEREAADDRNVAKSLTGKE